MALHTKLPIYRPVRRLIAMVDRAAENFPRERRGLSGLLLLSSCYAMAELICLANMADDKRPHLDQLLAKIASTQEQLRTAFDRGSISEKHYADGVTLTGLIGKQATGWRKSL